MDHLNKISLLVILEEGAALLDGAAEARLLLVKDRGRRQSLHLFLLLLEELAVPHVILLGWPVVVGAHLGSRGVQQSLVHLGRCEWRMLLVAEIIVLLEVDAALAKIFVTSSAVVFDNISVTTRAIRRVVHGLLRLAQDLRNLGGR